MRCSPRDPPDGSRPPPAVDRERDDGGGTRTRRLGRAGDRVALDQRAAGRLAAGADEPDARADLRLSLLAHAGQIEIVGEAETLEADAVLFRGDEMASCPKADGPCQRFQRVAVNRPAGGLDGEGDGKFERVTKGEDCESWIAYIVAEKP